MIVHRPPDSQLCRRTDRHKTQAFTTKSDVVSCNPMNDDDETPFRINDERILLPSFKKRIESYTEMLEFTDEANVHLQKRGITLGDAQLHLDFLIENIKESNASSPSSNHWAKDCKLGSVYISKDSSRLVSKEFHNGVIKIQSGGAMLLTAREAAAVA
jgi:hypothetical protein